MTKRIVNRFPCLLALLLWHAGGLVAQGTLEGHVRDAVTGRPLAGVQIFLPQPGTGVITDSEGHYELAGIPPGARGVGDPPHRLPHRTARGCHPRRPDDASRHGPGRGGHRP